MKILKKIWLLLAWFAVLLWVNFGFSKLIGNTPEYISTDHGNDDPIVSGNTIDNHESINQWSNTLSNKLNWIIHIPQSNEYETSLWYIIKLVQFTINRLLWILSFIALVYIIYNGFLIFISGSEDKNASKGKKWILTGAIAIAWIGLSWLIISAIIWLISNIAAN